MIIAPISTLSDLGSTNSDGTCIRDEKYRRDAVNLGNVALDIEGSNKPRLVHVACNVSENV